VPVIRKVHGVNYDASDGTYEFSDLVFERSPDSEFTLTHFGLPEVPFQDRTPSNPILPWLLGFACVGLIAAYCLRRLASRA
jgi:hypothetical protein